LIESIFKMQNIPVHHRANLYRLIGDCFAKLGDLNSAKDAYLKGVEFDPYLAKAYIGMGTVGLLRNSFDVAVLHFQKAISLAPEDEMSNLGLGLAFQGMNELAEASRWVVKALEVNPCNGAALFTLVKISYDREVFTEVEVVLNRYMKAEPNDTNIMFTLGGITFRQGRYEDTISIMQRIVGIDPADARAQSLMQQARAAMADVANQGSSSRG